MKRFGLQISFLALLLIPAMVAVGSWVQGRKNEHAVNRLEHAVTQLRVQIQDDRLLDELRGFWVEAVCRRDGDVIDYGEEAGRAVEVEWLLTPEGGSIRSVLKGEVESLDLGQFTVDSTKEPAWIDFRSRGGGRPFVCVGIVQVDRGYCDIGSAVIALSQPSWGQDPPPARPTTFESTAQNGVSVYYLNRDRRYLSLSILKSKR